MSNYNYLDDIDEGMDEPGAHSMQPERPPLSNFDRLLLKGKVDSRDNGSLFIRQGPGGGLMGLDIDEMPVHNINNAEIVDEESMRVSDQQNHHGSSDLNIDEIEELKQEEN